jgi:hypothetical protein
MSPQVGDQPSVELDGANGDSRPSEAAVASPSEPPSNAPTSPGSERVPYADPEDTDAARELVRRSPWREVGVVNAPWLLTHGVEHETWLEKGGIHVMLACPVVADVTHQPETIDIVLPDGSKHRYTPDFRVRLLDGIKVIVEVKPDKFVKQHEPILTAAAAEVRARGDEFMVITDKQIHGNSRSARAILLMRYGRLSFTPEEAHECKRLLEEEMASNAHVHELVERGISEDLVWHMVASHMLRTRMPLNIGRDEVVEINEPVENCLDHFQRWLGHSNR